MQPTKYIALLSNPAGSHKTLQTAEKISLLLKRHGARHSTFTRLWPSSFDAFTEVWLVGGDGTVNWFINQFPGVQLPLAVFNAGSGNDFHWMLYGNTTTEQQVERVLAGNVLQVDAGICNGRFFLNGAGIGFDGAIVKDLIGKRKLSGKASYLLSILKNIVGYTEKPCTIEMDGEVIRQDCFMISVANGRRYGGGFYVAPKAQVADGLLDMMVVGSISPMKRIKYLPVIEKGEHLGLPFITYRLVPRVRITSTMPVHAHLDGEYMSASVFEISMLPGRFSFLV
ncbi:MAG TPA: YegS/Rv2252/BmrU family lipid kinase [Flavisolibacter sp.]